MKKEKETYKVILADDVPEIVNTMERILTRDHSNIEVIGKAYNENTLQELIMGNEQIVEELIVILDLSFRTGEKKDEYTGFKIFENLIKDYPLIKIIIFSSYIGEDKPFFIKMYQKGIKGALNRSDLEQLPAAVKTVAKGGKQFSHPMSDWLDFYPSSQNLGLNKTLYDIYLEIIKGSTNNQLKEKFGYSSSYISDKKSEIKMQLSENLLSKNEQFNKASDIPDTRLLLVGLKRGDPEVRNFVEKYCGIIINRVK